MKHRIALVGSLLLSLAFAWSSYAEPVKVIFDTDMITDFDDVGALRAFTRSPTRASARFSRR